MITSEKIKNLRTITGAGMLDCKKALEEMDGDVEKSIDWLRKKGVNTAQKKSSRDASEGLITISISGNYASITEINSETDFVSRNDDFKTFCSKINLIALENKVSSLENLLEKKFDESKNVKDELTSMISKIGENIVLKRVNVRSSLEGSFQKYLHNSVDDNSGKIGVILEFKCDKKFAELDNISKNICMHIAAMDPKSITHEALDEEIKNREMEIFREQLKNSNKPDDIKQKIIEGKMNKFFEEVCLLDQYFVIDNKQKVKAFLSDCENKFNCKLEILSFVLFRVGEDNF
tara:strand:+ start:26265 stop:27137 length:873 start_codon:yes stop_codon:yes gene_type:complete